MIRDPFDIHRKNAFKNTALRAADHIRNAAAEVGANALKMPFNVPKNVPNFQDPHRALEDRAWAALPNARGAKGIFTGMQDRVNDFFDDDELPMYKDKPYGHGRRRRGWYRTKKGMASLALGLVFVLYLLGWLPWQHKETRSVGSAWNFLGISKERENVDWGHRREQVVEAFELSWDAYERYGWGMLSRFDI